MTVRPSQLDILIHFITQHKQEVPPATKWVHSSFFGSIHCLFPHFSWISLRFCKVLLTKTLKKFVLNIILMFAF